MRASTSHVFSLPLRKKAWYPPSASRWIMVGAPFEMVRGHGGSGVGSLHRDRPQGARRRFPLRGHGEKAGRRGAPRRAVPAAGPEDTDKPAGRARRAARVAARTAQVSGAAHVGSISASGPATSSYSGLRMAWRWAQSPTIPSATRLRPGLDARDAAPSLEDEEQASRVVGEHALEVGGARPGLNPHRLDPAGHPDPRWRHWASPIGVTPWLGWAKAAGSRRAGAGRRPLAGVIRTGRPSRRLGAEWPRKRRRPVS